MFKSRFLVLAFALFLAWLGAFFLLHVAAFLLRTLLVLSAVLFIAHLIMTRKKA